MTFSGLFRSGNDNLTFLAKLSLLYAFRANSSIGMFIVSEMTENPTAKYEKFWFRASLLINFRSAGVVVSVAPMNYANYASFSDLVLLLGHPYWGSPV